jgi:hypothetical protein
VKPRYWEDPLILSSSSSLPNRPVFLTSASLPAPHNWPPGLDAPLNNQKSAVFASSSRSIPQDYNVPATLPPRPAEATSSISSRKRSSPSDDYDELNSLRSKLRRLESQRDGAHTVSKDLRNERDALKKEVETLKAVNSLQAKLCITPIVREQSAENGSEALRRIRAMLPGGENPQSVIGNVP